MMNLMPSAMYFAIASYAAFTAKAFGPGRQRLLCQAVCAACAIVGAVLYARWWMR